MNKKIKMLFNHNDGKYENESERVQIWNIWHIWKIWVKEHHASPLFPEPQEDPWPNIAPGWKIIFSQHFKYKYDNNNQNVDIGQTNHLETLFFMVSGAQLISFILMAVQNMPSALPVM